MEIVGLYRYPVKSTGGEALAGVEGIEVGPRGLVGDRGHAVRDDGAGVVLTGRRVPPLLLARGVLDADGRASVELPDGRRTSSDDELSAWLGRPVRLVGAVDEPSTYEIPVDPEDDDSPIRSWQGPVGSYHDSTRTQVSVVATGDLGGWDVRRFRPNVVVGGDTVHDLVGARVRLGTAVLDVVKHIDRCVMVTRPQRDGIARDLDVLRTIVRDRGNRLGVGALVVTPGHVRLGDALTPL